MKKIIALIACFASLLGSSLVFAENVADEDTQFQSLYNYGCGCGKDKDKK